MATSSTYYLDGIDLSDATSVYTDIQLTTLAPDGWYSNGVIAREQISGILQAEETCDDCGGPPPTTVEVAAVYLVSGDCATGDPSDPFDGKVWIESSWGGFIANGSGKLVVNNTPLFAELPARYYDPIDPNVIISAGSITSDTTGTINPNNNTGDGVYLVQNTSLNTTGSDNIKATVASNPDPTLSDVTFELCP